MTVQAATIYWDGTGTDWQTAGNWSTDSGAATPNPGAVPGTADVATFSTSTVTTAQTVNLNANQSVLGLSFTSSQAHSLVGGGTDRILTLAGSGITKTGTGAVTIGSVTVGQQVTLALSANQTWSNDNNTGALSIANGVTASSATNRTLTLSGTSTAINTVSGIIANNGAGIMTLTKSGAGTWLLAGANTHTGRTTISAGLLQLGHATALGSTTGGTTISGGTLDLNGQTVGAEAITFSGTSSLVNNSATAASLSGAIGSVQTATSMGGSGNLLLSGVISSSGTSTADWTKIGTGTLTLTGNNVYRRILTITEGVVNIQHANALGRIDGGTSVIAGAALQIQGGITVGAEALTLRGTGISNDGALRNISGTNVYGGRITFGSATRINSDAGTLTLNNTNAITGATFGLSVGGAGNTTITSVIGTTTGSLTKDGAGILTLSGANTFSGVKTLSGGILSVATIGNGGVAGNLGAATSTASNLVFDGGTLRYTGASASSNRNFTINTGKVATFEVTANTLTLSGASPATTGGLIKSGAGGLTLTASQLYTGATTISAGTLRLSGAGAISDSSAVNLSGATGVFNLSAITASGETIGSLAGISGSSVVLGAKRLTTGGDATSTTFGGVLSGAGGSLTKLGAGTMTLTGSNTYTGGTTITAGALSVAASSALGLETNALTIGSGATLKATASFTTSRATVLGGSGGSGGTFEVAAGQTLDYTSSSSISGTGSLIKTGDGTLFLEGTNNHTGGIYMLAGTLAANSQEALGAVPAPGSSDYGLYLYGGATFQTNVGSWATYRQLELVSGVGKVDITGSFSHQRNGLITGVGKLDLVGSGTLIVTAANTYSGGTLIENGTLQVNNSSGSATGTGAVTVANGGTLSGLPTAAGFPGVTGSVSGAVTVQLGGKLLAGSGTTLTLGALALESGSLNTFQLGAVTSTSLVNVTGSDAFTLPGSGTATIEIVNSGLLGTGTYHLFDYAGGTPLNLSNLVLANTHSGLYTLSLANNPGNTSIDLDVSLILQQWKKGGVDTNWSTEGNWWVPGGGPNAVGAEALFINNDGTAGFGAAEAVTLDVARTVGSVVFQNAATAFTIGSSTGGTLTLDEISGNVTIDVVTASTTANHVISVPLILADHLAVDIAAGSYGLDLSGVISGSGKNLTKTGLGPLTLSGAAANTYNGLTQVAGGTLNLNKSGGVNAIGTGGLQIDTGASVLLLASNQLADGATVTVNGTFALGTASETIAILSGTGAVTTGSGAVLTLDSATSSTFLGIVSGAGGLAKAGSGTLTLNGVNSYSGGTAISGGTLRVGADQNLGGAASNLTFGGGTLSFSSGFTSARNLLLNSGGGTLDLSGSTVTLTGTISGTGTLTKAGSGTVLLGSANSYSGATIVSGGVLQISNASSLGTTAAGTTVQVGGELEINSSGLTLNEPLTLDGGVFCNLIGTNTQTGAITLTANSGIDADSTKLIITSVISGSFGVTTAGPGIVEFKGANSYSGATTVLAGTLGLFNGAAIVDTGAVTLANTVDVVLQLNASERIGSLAGGGTSGGHVVLGATTLTTGDATDTSFGGSISGAGGILIKLGSGTMTLTGSSSYTGGTTISGGALSVAASSALGLEAGHLTIGSGATLKVTESFTTSRATTLGGSGGASSGGTFEVAAGKTLDLASGSTISGTGSLIKTGDGTLFLEGTNNHTGGIYMVAGTLAANSQEALGAVPIPGDPTAYGLHLYSGATFQVRVGSWVTSRQLELVSGTGNVDITNGFSHQRNGLITGAGALGLVGTGTLIVTAANTYSGGTLIENGTLQVNNSSGSATGTGAVTVASGGTLSGLPTAAGFSGATGSITGSVLVDHGGTLLTRSGTTLTLGGLTLTEGSLSTFQLGAVTSTSLITVSGTDAFTLPGTGTSTISIVNTGAMGVGTYHLFDYAGAAVANFPALALANAQSGSFNFSLVNNTSNTSVDLDVAAILQQWKKVNGNTNWSNTSHWWTDVVPNSAGAAAAFLDNNAAGGGAAFGTTETVTIDGTDIDHPYQTVGSIAFQNTGTAFTIEALSGKALILDNNGVNASIQVLSARSTANHVISAPVILADHLTVDIASGSYGLDLSGNISGIDQTVTKTGAGPLTLSGAVANTYTGLTDVAAGTLNLNKTAGIDAIGSGGLQIESGASVVLLASNQIANDATVTVNGTFALGTRSETIAALGGNGAVTTGSGGLLTVSGDADSVFLGILSGAGGLAKAGAGILTLNGSNSYTGGTTLDAGSLQVGADQNLGGAGSLTFGGGTLLFSGGFTSARNVLLNSGGGTLDTNGSAVTMTGVISGSGNLTKVGNGTVTLSTANSYSGATVINQGILQVTNAFALGTTGAGTTIDPDGELELNASGLTLSEPLTLNGGVFCNLASTNTQSGVITLTANSGIEADAGTLIVTSAIGESGGSYGFAVNAPGIVELKGTNTYGGTTHVMAGTLRLYNGAAISNSGMVMLHDVAGATLELSANETIGSLSGGGATGGNLVLGSRTLTTGDATDTSYGGIIGGVGGALVKQGAGTMTLSGINTYTGGTTISVGALSVASSAGLGLESNGLTFGSGATLKVTDSFTTSRATVLGGSGGAGGTFEVASGKTLNYTSSSAISGTGSLIKTGAGTLFLEGTNNHTGGIYMVAGTLAANSQEALGAVPAPGSSDYGLYLYDGATFQTRVGSLATYRQLALMGDQVGTGGLAKVDVTNGFTHQRDGLITGAGKLNLVGTGTLIVTAANTYTGGTLISNGVLQVSNSSGSATGTGAVTVANGGTLKGSTSASKGFITGTVTVQSGGGLSAFSGETLTLGGLTLGAGSLGTFQLGAVTTTPLVAITGSNGFIRPSSSTATLSIVNSGAMGVGTYRLFDYTGTAFSDIATLALAQANSGLFNLSLVNNTGNTSVDLSVTAISQQWKKGVVNSHWSNSANWWTDAVPNGIGANALFLDNNSAGGGAAFGATETITIDSSKTVGSVALQNTGTAFTIGASSGQTLTLDVASGNATISVLSAPVTANHGISAPLILADHLTVDIASGSYGLDLGGVLSGTDKTLTKTGAGPLTLSGAAANTYSGLTTAGAGTLNLNKTAGVHAIGSGGLQIDSGATVVLLASNQIADSATVTVSGTFALGSNSETIAILAGGGAVTTGSGGVLTLNSAADSTFVGVLSGAGGLVKTGASRLTLNGTNSYTGGTAIHAGTLQVGADVNLGGAGAITFDGGTLHFSSGFSSARNLVLNSGGGTLDTDGTSATLTGAISGSGSLSKNGSGTLTLSTGANNYTGATTVNSGVLNIRSNSALGTTAGGVAVVSGAALELQGGISVGAEALTLNGSGVSAGGALRNISGNNTYGGTVTLASDSKIASDAEILTLTGAIGGDFEKTFAATGGITANGIISGTGGVIKTGTGTLIFTGLNTFTGPTTLTGGTLQLGSGGSLGGGSGITVSADGLSGLSAVLDLNGLSATIGSLTLGGPGAGVAKTNTVQTGAGTLTLGGNVLFNGDQGTQGSNTITGNLALGSVTRSFTVNGSGSTLGVSAAVSGSGGLTKAGAGMLTLAGGNTYAGGTTLSAGTLALESAGALGGGGSLTFTGGTLRYSASNTTDYASRIVSSTAPIAIDTNGQSVTWSSILASSNIGGLTKAGSGTLTLAGSNAYTGTTSILGGSLVISSAANLSASPITINSGILQATGGSYTLGSARTVTLTHDGTLQGDAAGLTVDGTIANGGHLLTVTGSGSTTLSGIISGAGGLTKTGAGTLILSAPNTFGGDVAITQGVVRISNNTSLGASGTGAATVVSGAVLEVQGGITVDLPLVLNGTGISNGGALRSISGNNQMVGVFTLGSDTHIGSDAGLLTISNVISSSGTDLGIVGAGNVTLGALSIGAKDLTKDGAGVLTLAGISSHKNTLVNAGQLNVNVSQALGEAPGGALTLASGVTLDNTSGAAVNILTDRTISVGGTLLFTGTRSLGLGAGAVTLASPVANYTTITVNGSTLTLNGKISGSSGLVKNGPGVLQLGYGGLHDYVTGGGGFNTIIDAGELYLAASGASLGGQVQVNTGGIFRTAPGVSIAEANVILNGGTWLPQTVTAGNVTFEGNTSLSSATALYDGKLTVNAAITNPSNNDWLGYNPVTPVADRVTFNSGSSLIASVGFTVAANKGIQLASGIVTFEATANNLDIESIIAGSGQLRKTGSGHLHLSGTNTYSGGTLVEGGVLGITSDAALGATSGALVLNNGLLEANFQGLVSPATLTLSSSRSIQLTSGSTASGIGAHSNTTLLFDGVISQTSSGSAVLRIGQSGLLNGVVKLTGANTYSGATEIHSGTLEITSIQNGGIASPLGASSSDNSNLILHGGTLKYTGAAATTDRLFSVGTEGATLDASGTGKLTFGGSGTIGFNGEFGARDLVLTGSGAGEISSMIIADDGAATTLYKRGSGTWTLGGTNLYTGKTVIEAGSLQIGADAALGATAAELEFAVGSTGRLTTTASLVSERHVSLLGNGSLETTAGIATFSGPFSGSGQLTKEGAGTLVLSGDSSGRSGATAISAGTLRITTATALGSGAVSIASGAVFNLGYYSTTLPYLLGNTITGAGALTNELTGGNASTVALTGTASNTFSGLTTVNDGTLWLDKTSTVGAPVSAIGGNALVNGGTLAIRASEQIPNTATVTVSGGVFEFDAGMAPGRQETISSLVSSGGLFNTRGNTLITGSLELSGNGDTVNVNSASGVAGTLEIGSSLLFSGGTNPTLTIDSETGTANRLLLKGNVSSTLADGTAQILSGLNNIHPGTIDLDGATRTFTIANGSAATDMAVSAAMSNGGLTKAGAGTLMLSGVNTFTGDTTISGGTLALASGTSLASSVIRVGDVGSTGAVLDVTAMTGGFTIGSGQKLTGIGTLEAAGPGLTIEGTHAPGNSPGLQTIHGQTSYGPSSIFEWELTSDTTAGRGTNFDAVNITGGLSINSAAVFKVVLNVGSSVDVNSTFWASNRSWDVFNATGSMTGGFQVFDVTVDSGGNYYTAGPGAFSYSSSGGVGTLNWTVPEPSGALVGLLLASGLFYRRRD